MNPESVTAVVLARNEARNLPRLFDALPAGMRVLVLDHRSTDETAAIARARGACVVQRDFDGFVNARRFALAQVDTAWTFMIDADETPDAALCDALVSASETPDGYYVVRTTFYRGKALRMWRGERLLRLFKTHRARLESAPAAGGQAQLHEHWEVDGATATLNGTLLHDSYPTHESYRAKFESYTAIEAGGLPPSRGALLRESLRAPLRFAWYALARGAALDGADGLRVAWSSAWYQAVVRRKALLRGAGR